MQILPTYEIRARPPVMLLGNVLHISRSLFLQLVVNINTLFINLKSSKARWSSGMILA